MTDDRTSTLDPRFNAAFQRGATGAVAPVHPRDASDSEFIVAPEPRRAPVDDDRPRARDEVPGIPRVASGDLAEDEAAVDEIVIVRERTRAWPWELGILVAGIVLVAAGGIGVWLGMGLTFSGIDTSRTQSLQEVHLRQIGILIGPYVTTVGLAALVGLLFLRAARAGASR